MGVSGDPSSARGGREMLVVGPWRVGEGSVLSRIGVSAPAPAVRPCYSPPPTGSGWTDGHRKPGGARLLDSGPGQMRE